MNNIKIKTLTPIHVGSGTELQGNFEYLYFKNEQKIAVVDAEKVLRILGEDNLPQWIACIDNNQPLLPVLEQRSKNLRASDVAEREIPLSIATDKPIRAQIHSGNGRPILPGSSLKGAIRTTVWASTILDNMAMVKDHRNLKNYKGGWSDENVAKTIFGGDPNHDIFRLLQIGDIEFNATEAYKTDVINMYGKSWKLKSEITQFVEAIPANVSSTFRINHNDLLLKRAPNDFFNRNKQKLELDQLFPLINNQTGRLVEDEINYWDEKEGNPEALGDYVDEMQRICDIINTCAANECVLRLGWGSGFRSMTGDWHGAMNDEDFYRLVKSIRPKHPDDLVFPKTTRFVAGGMPLGFVKMSF
jgi:CRISPR-associated protein Csm5